jgi:hypothetical protein
MILLGSLIVVFFIVLAFSSAGWEHAGTVGTLFGLPGLICVLFLLFLTTGYILVCGYKQFLAGLPAILHRPAQSQPDIADYYRQLANYTLACGASLAITLSIVSLSLAGDQALCQQILMTAISMFCYSSWLSLLFFLPIAFQFSDDDWKDKLWYFLVGPAVVGLLLLPGVFAGMCINWVGVSPLEVLQNNADYNNYFNILLWYDVASFILILATITALRLGMGKLQNRYIWIPICVIVGTLWTLQGITMMLADLHLEIFYIGFLVALITTLYSFICVIAVIVNRAWFFTTLCGFLALCFFAFGGEPNTPILVMPLVIALSCAVGRFCDMFYLSVTRYESFSGLFTKHIIDWIIFGSLAVLLMLCVFIAFLVRVLFL